MVKLSTLETKKIRERMLPAKSADVYDTLDAMDIVGQCLDLKIKPLRDDMKVVGQAFTYLGTTEPRVSGNLPGQYQNPLFDNQAMFDRIYEGSVIVLNAEKDDVVGHWGEMLSYGARNKGAVGAVIDGGTRDKEGILNIDNWSCFAKYCSPIEADRNWRPKTLLEPIFLSGTITKYVRVDPGDWIFGDCDGVIVIPQKILMEMLPKLEERMELEDIAAKELANGAQLKEVRKKYPKLQ